MKVTVSGRLEMLRWTELQELRGVLHTLFLWRLHWRCKHQQLLNQRLLTSDTSRSHSCKKAAYFLLAGRIALISVNGTSLPGHAPSGQVPHWSGENVTTWKVSRSSGSWLCIHDWLLLPCSVLLNKVHRSYSCLFFIKTKLPSQLNLHSFPI